MEIPVLRLLAVTLLSFLCAALMFSAYVVAAPGEVREKAFFSVLIIPVLWCGLMVYSYWDHVPWRPAAIYSLLSLMSAGFIFLAEIPE